MKKISEDEIVLTMKTALGNEGKKLTRDSTVNDIPSWDSLGHLGVLAALDQKLEGQAATIDDLATADSVKKIIDILKKNGLM